MDQNGGNSGGGGFVIRPGSGRARGRGGGLSARRGESPWDSPRDSPRGADDPWSSPRGDPLTAESVDDDDRNLADIVRGMQPGRRPFMGGRGTSSPWGTGLGRGAAAAGGERGTPCGRGGGGQQAALNTAAAAAASAGGGGGAGGGGWGVEGRRPPSSGAVKSAGAGAAAAAAGVPPINMAKVGTPGGRGRGGLDPGRKTSARLSSMAGLGGPGGLGCGHPTAWTIIQQNGPNHLGLWYNALPGHQMGLITSGCVPFRPAPGGGFSSNPMIAVHEAALGGAGGRGGLVGLGAVATPIVVSAVPVDAEMEDIEMAALVNPFAGLGGLQSKEAMSKEQQHTSPGGYSKEAMSKEQQHTGPAGGKAQDDSVWMNSKTQDPYSKAPRCGHPTTWPLIQPNGPYHLSPRIVVQCAP